MFNNHIILMYKHVIYNLWKSSSCYILLKICFLQNFKKYKLYRRIAFVSCHSYIDKQLLVILIIKNLHWSWSRYVQLILCTFLCVICILEWHPFVLCFNFKNFNAFIVPLGPDHNFIFTHSYLIIIFNRFKILKNDRSITDIYVYLWFHFFATLTIMIHLYKEPSIIS